MDWIASRVNCSTENAWLTLKALLRSDIERHKLLVPESLTPEVSDADRIMSISKRKTFTHPFSLWVSIEKRESDFVIRTPNPDNAAFPNEVVLIPRLTASAECKLYKGNEEFQFWEVSRLVLEPILF